MKLKWTKQNDQHTAFSDPYYAVVHRGEDAWHVNCFILEDGGAETWIGGSELGSDLQSLTEAKKLAAKLMKEYDKENPR